MPARISADAAAAWEVALSVSLMLLATSAMVRFAARVYANALLRTGDSVPLTDALRRGPAAAGGRG